MNKKSLNLHNQNRQIYKKKTQNSDEDNSNQKNYLLDHSNSEDYQEDFSQQKQKNYQSSQPNNKQSSAYPLLQFQEFHLDKKIIDSKTYKQKKISIEVPDVKFSPQKSITQQINYQEQQTDLLKHYICKQPPAPSKGSTKAKVFIFPTSTNSIQNSIKNTKNMNVLCQSKNKVDKNQGRYNNDRMISEQKKYKEDINGQMDLGKLDKKQKQRKQKDKIQQIRQKYEKQLTIKNSQIQMLQKIISDHLHKKNIQIKNIEEAEKIINEKDNKIKQLMDKLSQFSILMKNKNDQLVNMRINYCKLQNSLQNLQMEIYINNNKQQNQKLTRDFYKFKGFQQKLTKSVWDYKQQENLQHHNQPHKYQDHQNNHSNTKPDNCIKNIQDLQKRLDYLKSNRIQLQISKSRNNTKAQHKSNLSENIKDENNLIWCSQTSKHKPKGNFDFKSIKQKQKTHYDTGFDKIKKRQIIL